MGLLADAFSYGDSLKRKVGGLLGDPFGTLEQMAGQFKDEQRNTNNLQDNAYPRVGDRTVLNSPAQIAQFRQQLADKASDMAMSAATVWHGPNPKNNMDADELKNLISSQRYLDRDIVAKKIKEGNFKVTVTPEFELDGKKVRAIQDGHHALEAAIRSGNNPRFVVNTPAQNDRVQLLKDGNIDGFLEASYHDAPWYNFASKRDLF